MAIRLFWYSDTSTYQKVCNLFGRSGQKKEHDRHLELILVQGNSFT